MNGQELGDSLNKAKALRDGGRCSLVRGSIAMECHGRRHSKSFKIQKRLFFDAFPAEPSQKVEFAVFLVSKASGKVTAGEQAVQANDTDMYQQH